MPDFTYVLIPADDSLPFRELSAAGVSYGDTLAELLKADFAGGGLSNLGELRAQFGEAIDAKMDDLQAVANGGTVEVLPLVRTSKTTLPNPNTATFLYYDEMGALKNRPPNRRAHELAKQCGVDLELPLPGDVYVGRVCCDPGPCSTSIGKHELDSSSPWIRQAPLENAQFKDALSDLSAVTKAKQVGAKTAEEEEAENISRGWRWTQSEAEIEVTAAVPEGTKAGGLSVVIGRSTLRITLKSRPTEPLVDLKMLYAPVRPDDSTWTLGSDERGPHVQVTIEKEDEQTWPLLEAKHR